MPPFRRIYKAYASLKDGKMLSRVKDFPFGDARKHSVPAKMPKRNAGEYAPNAFVFPKKSLTLCKYATLLLSQQQT